MTRSTFEEMLTVLEKRAGEILGPLPKLSLADQPLMTLMLLARVPY